MRGRSPGLAQLHWLQRTSDRILGIFLSEEVDPSDLRVPARRKVRYERPETSETPNATSRPNFFAVFLGEDVASDNFCDFYTQSLNSKVLQFGLQPKGPKANPSEAQVCPASWSPSQTSPGSSTPLPHPTSAQPEVS